MPPSPAKTEFKWSIEPTCFYRRENRVIQIHISGLTRSAPIAVEVDLHDTPNVFDMTQGFDLGMVPAGDSIHDLELPAYDTKVSARVTVIVGGRHQTQTIPISPARKWTVHVFHHSHCDVGFTHTPNKVAQLHNKYTDSAIEFCHESAKWGDTDARFKWVVETAWQAQNYLRMRPEAQVKEFLRLVKQGRIEISAMYLGEHLDNLGNEALIRSIYYGGELRREHGLPITSAMLCDVTGFPWQFGQILARAGIKYFHWAPNGFASAFFHHHKLQRPCRWEAPDGSRTLLWHTDDPKLAYIEGYRWGFGKDLDTLRRELPKKLADLEKGGFPYDMFPMEVACDNRPPMFEVAEQIRDWNRRYTWPRLVFSTVTGFFEAFENRHGSSFPVARGDMNNWWGRIITGYPYETSFECDTRERLQRAERTGAAASIERGKEAYDRTKAGHAYDDVLVFEEHSGTGTIWKCKSDRDQRNALKQGLAYAYHARDLSVELDAETAKAVAEQIPAATTGAVAVWNSLFHERDGLVEMPVPASRVGEGKPMHALPIGGEEKLPVQIIASVGAKGSARALFPARALPSYGYRCYVLRPGAADESGIVEAGDGWMENRFYRLELNPYTGEIATLFDKELNRELTDPRGLARFTEVIYHQPILKHLVPMGGDLTKFEDMYSRGPIPGKTRRVPRPKRKRDDIVVVESGPVRARLHVPAEPLSNPMVRRDYVLYADQKRLDLQFLAVPLPGNPVLHEELLSHTIGAAFLSFPFAVPEGKFLMEYAHGILRPVTDQLPGACMDHYSMGHWCGLSNSDFGILFASRNMPKIELGEPCTVKFRHDRKNPGPAIYVPIGGSHRKKAPAKKHLFDDIHPERKGPVPFNFSISSHKGRTVAADAYRFGWEAANPPEALPLKKKEGLLPSDACSFCECLSRNVVVSNAKLAEDGNGIILRLWEIAGKGDTVSLRFPRWKLTQAWRASILEENEAELSCAHEKLEFRMEPNEIATVRLQCAPRA